VIMKHYTQDIRSGFINYFKKHQHKAVASSSVIPHQDPTLLFVNAGMNQFKDVFLGTSVRDYTRAVTAQKCIRAGGKHNDLENVGHTTRHLTFFEMLGNFSFGDYFKEDAIKFAYEVSTEIFGFEEEKIWATVFREDDEAYELWRKILPESRICRMDEKDNFWAMGDTGPCGPCSELLYDRGSHFSSATSPLQDPTGERFLEFWNLVFMQFNKDASGKMEKLPKQSIDTGAGLERVISLKMGVDTVFATDVLRDLIAGVEELSSVRYEGEFSALAPAFHVIADHLRCLSFAIADGAQPSNIERGYVLRKILRRAVRYGRMLKFEAPFLGKLLPRLISSMQDPYSELALCKNRIEEILTLEEEAFFRTLKRGGNLLSQVVQKAEKGDKKISGDDAFKLKDTYGLPLDEILLLAKDSELSLDLDRYQLLEKEAKERSKAASKEFSQVANETLFEGFVKENGPTQFLGYKDNKTESKVIGIFKEGQFVDHAQEGDEVLVFLDKTPFYAEKGGQVGDKGILKSPSCQLDVIDTLSPFAGLIAHKAYIKLGSLALKEDISALIDNERRLKIQNNHTATHLLHWALQKVVGDHIKQAGSVVDDQRLRFDFNHHKALSDEEILLIEDLVNEKIKANQSVSDYEISYEEAQKKKEIKQFFGDKYGSLVRVIDIDFCKELCGGTHTTSTGNIGYFRIVKEGSISAGVRRIEAVSGKEAEQYARDQESLLKTAANLLKTSSALLPEKIERLIKEAQDLQKELKSHAQEKLKKQAKELVKNLETIGDVPCVFALLQKEAATLKDLADLISNDLKSFVVVLASVEEDKVQFLTKISSDLHSKGLIANSLIKEIAPLIGGSGGGKQDMAQAGGKEKDKAQEALNHAKKWIQTHT
jgi:alanyl-tRNA synthetase